MGGRLWAPIQTPMVLGRQGMDSKALHLEGSHHRMAGVQVDTSHQRMAGVRPDISRHHSIRELLSAAVVEVSPSRFRIVAGAH